MNCGKRKLCNNNTCEICFNKSFASHEKSKYWNFELNNTKPRLINKNTHDKHWFKCEICEHDFLSMVSNIVSKNRWCPYCSNQKLCYEKNCKICFYKSAQSLEQIKYWNYKLNNKHPRLIFKQSSPKRWFDCENCGHSYNISLNAVNRNGCSYCGNKKLCDNDNCKTCFNKSFASHEKSKFWNFEMNNNIPRNIFKCSSKKFWFRCYECKNNFDIRIYDINNGKWCKYCKNKSEKILLDYLKTKYKNVKFQAKFNWCKKKTYLPFDFCINKTIISLDGDQHFKDMKHWNSNFQNQVKTDNYKMQKAIDNGYNIIRIYQPYVYKNKNNWKMFLEKSIKYSFSNKSCIIIQQGTEELYKNHTIKNMDKISIKK